MATTCLKTLAYSGIPGYDSRRDANGCWFDETVAGKAITFIERHCRHVEGGLAGKPFVLEDWEKAVVANLFGWKRKDSKGRTVRRYRETLLYVPRKNGKTPFGACLLNTVLFGDGEPGAQIYGAAASADQAALLFRQARGMVELNPQLAARAQVYRALKAIVLRNDPASVYKVISADGNVQHGGNSHLILIDELHAQPDRDLVDVLLTSTASANRSQPLIVYITTADYHRPSICNEIYDRACRVRDGVDRDPAFLPVVYEALPDDDWTSPGVWAKANPNLGVSVSLDYLRRECLKAQELPSYENTFRRLHLNMRTQQDVRWLPMGLWDKGSGAVEEENLADRECYVGIDFGWRDDLAALVAVFPPTNDDNVYRVLPRFWLPRDCRRDLRSEPFHTFVSSGLLSLTDGNATDVEAIYKAVDELSEKYRVREIVLDPSNARKQGQDFEAEGYEVWEFRQTKPNYNEACRLLEVLLKEGQILHGGEPILRWMAGNVAIETDGLGQIMPKKKKSPEKIDGICALLMALSRAMLVAPQSYSVEVW